jgi:hypothetical protein
LARLLTLDAFADGDRLEHRASRVHPVLCQAVTALGGQLDKPRRGPDSDDDPEARLPETIIGLYGLRTPGQDYKFRLNRAGEVWGEYKQARYFTPQMMKSVVPALAVEVAKVQRITILMSTRQRMASDLPWTGWPDPDWLIQV